MKKLILARHAKSSWEHAIADIERPLNNRGLHDAPVMADYLKSQGVNVDIIISSPALRAKTTAQFYFDKLLNSGQKLKIDDSIYDAYEQDLLKIINELDEAVNSVMLVGHNPTFTLLANILANERIVNMPTCSSVTICFDVSDWMHVKAGAGAMERFDYPKKLNVL